MSDIELLENQIIGSFILDKDTHRYINKLTEGYFSLDNSRKIFNVIKQLYKENEEISVITINNKLAVNTDKTQVLKKLFEITDNIITTSDIKIAVEKLKDNYNRKQIHKLILKVNKDIRNADKTVSEIKTENMQDVFIKVLGDIEEKKQKGDYYSFYTGFFDLDKYTDGLHNSELTCIGARPGVGKTAFALNIAINIAQKGKKVYFCSLEMSAEQIMQRIIGYYTGINTQFLRTGRLKNEEMERIAEQTNNILSLNLKIDTKIRYVEDLENVISALKEKEEIDILIVDYLTLLKSKEKFAIRELEVAEISRKLKLLALDLKIPVVILVQLNRDAENKVPTMANIRESGSIEQNCDNIIFLHNEDLDKQPNIITVILEKQRQGTTGSLKLMFNKRYSRFVNIVR